MDFWHRLRDLSTLHSAIRFAIAIVVADAVVWWLFRDGTPVVMGSFAVICLLYFLDYAGSTSERLVGYIAAATVGAGAVAMGSVLAGPLWLAVVGAFLVSFAFAYARVLRGYVARASVGLQGAFFLPLMADVTPSEAPAMTLSWLVGSGVAMLAGMLILPRQRPGVVVDLVRQWLAMARDVTSSRAVGQPSGPTTLSLVEVSRQLGAHTGEALEAVGLVGPHDRALLHLVDGTQWGVEAVELLDDGSAGASSMPAPTRLLLTESARAFDQAEAALGASPAPRQVPDLAAIRQHDLHSLTQLSDRELQQHYPARIISILAMRMLWLAGRVRGIDYPKPDLGSTADRSPLALLRLNFGLRSVWFVNALRTGASTAACVLLVRELGLDHGLWVVLAALSVTTVSFSASASGYSSLRMALGAMSGVVLASLVALLGLPHVAYVILLPLLAFGAVIAARQGPFLAQAVYTPFALTNLAAIQWATDRDLEVIRVENITLGVLVAAAFALMVFPYGLTRQLVRQVREADATSRSYLVIAIDVAKGTMPDGAPAARAQCVRAVTRLESTLSASAGRSALGLDAERAGHDADARARDRLIGGDACVDLGRQRSDSAALGRVAEAFAQWWEDSTLLAGLRAKAHGPDQ